MYRSDCFSKMPPIHGFGFWQFPIWTAIQPQKCTNAPPKNSTWISYTPYQFHYQMWQRHNNIQVLRKLKLTQNSLKYTGIRGLKLYFGFFCVIFNQNSDIASSFNWRAEQFSVLLGRSILLPRLFKAHLNISNGTISCISVLKLERIG